MIVVYHNGFERGVATLVGRLRKAHNKVDGRDLKYFSGEADPRATEVYSPKYLEELAQIYGERYKTKPRGKKNGLRDSK